VLFVPRNGVIGAWRRMLLAQGGISLVMAPLTMYWFQQASLPGFLANLAAIPLVSMLVVPLILLALPLLWLPGPLAPWLLNAAGHVAQGLISFLEVVARLQPDCLSAARTPGLLATLVAMIGGLVLTLPRGATWRFLGLLLIVPALLPPKPGPGAGETQVDMLDVGQGQAVLVTGKDMQVLYDTGPGNGLSGEDRWDLADGAIVPVINSTGHAPDLVVASHADLDHSGGLQRLLEVYPRAHFIGSFPEPVAGVARCKAPLDWRAGDYSLAILHPSGGLPYLGNASSCTLSIRGPGTSILLGGDINAVVEQRLVTEGLGHHGLLVAPHHGSSTSSSVALLEAARPSLALVSAGADNRFGLPHASVLERFDRAGIPVLNTALCGGVRITVGQDGVARIESARAERGALWRYVADTSCIHTP
jgi:competence protein ComEC